MATPLPDPLGAGLRCDDRCAARFEVLSREQAQALTRAIHLLRPSWNEGGIFAALAKCQGRPSYDVALAALRAASDPGAKTPGVIPTPGPHWNELPPAERPVATYRPPRRGEDCPLHPGQYADACSGCAADRQVGDTTDAADLHRPDGSNSLTLARAALAAAKSTLCSHGVPHNACHQHPATSPASTKEPA